MKIEKLLPIGSVVLLEGGEKRLMITGILQSEAGGDGTEFDYLGVLYPEGHIGEKFQYMFNHEDIKEIFFVGYEDSERTAFLKQLSGIYEGRA